MNAIAERIFKNKSVDLNKLVGFGFEPQGDRYAYRMPVCAGELTLTVTVKKDGGVDAEVTDTDTGDEYTLYLVEEAEGSFVGSVREAVESALTDIAERCFGNTLHGAVARDAVAYVKEKYGDELEYLWDDENAVWRRKDGGKWYGALLYVSKRKLGLDSDEKTPVLDLRMKPEVLDALADGKKYFRGYHMNKKHWVTICLDGTVEREEIFRLIDESYRLAVK